MGEVVAKMIAARGGDVRLTYNNGKEDANKIVEEIRSSGRNAKKLKLDVMNLDSDNLEEKLGDWIPTHLYYFTAPHIDMGRKGVFSKDIYQNLSLYFVDRFHALVKEVHLFNSNSELTVFYPSTIFLDQPPADGLEYCASKAAGEAICKSLEKKLPCTRFHVPRLPRVNTDHTASFMTLATSDTLEVMLDAVRKMNLKPAEDKVS